VPCAIYPDIGKVSGVLKLARNLSLDGVRLENLLLIQRGEFGIEGVDHRFDSVKVEDVILR